QGGTQQGNEAFHQPGGRDLGEVVSGPIGEPPAAHRSPGRLESRDHPLHRRPGWACTRHVTLLPGATDKGAAAARHHARLIREAEDRNRAVSTIAQEFEAARSPSSSAIPERYTKELARCRSWISTAASTSRLAHASTHA